MLLLSCIVITTELMYASVTMFLVIQGHFKTSFEKGQKTYLTIFMPKNINSITIIIVISEGMHVEKESKTVGDILKRTAGGESVFISD